MALLEVENLKVSFETPSGPFAAVDGVSLCVQPGETLAIVGQSGCGKTVLCRNLMRLCTGGSRAQGSIRLEGRELLGLSEKAMRQIRGKQMAYLFQEPHLALSPSFSIGAQIAEAILVHEKAGKKGARERAMRLIELVRLKPSCYFAYPHQLSGVQRAFGMRRHSHGILSGCARLQLPEAQMSQAIRQRGAILRELGPLFGGVLLDLKER